jgi:adenosylcobyric acid synthase
VCGTASGVGKSTIVAALCRLLARRGAHVAPFKAQNMSNHAAVTPDGGEIGRAQAAQAAAAGVEIEAAMNPVLLKPMGDRTSSVVVLGRECGTTGARDWGERTDALKPVVLQALRSLRERHDVVVAEGAGGAAEINLLGRDLVNLPLAAAAGLPVVLVADIDRGGAFASAYGTLALLPDHLRATVAGIVLNRFRGDPSLLDPGIAELERRGGVPVWGVLPWLDGGLLQTEDSLDLVGWGVERPAAPDPLRIAVIRLPHLANPSDLDPLVVEPDVELVLTSRPADVARADLVIVPGTRATVADLRWLRERGLDVALAATDAVVVGLCGGYQHLGRRILDEVESGAGEVDGLGLLAVETVFSPEKVVRRRTGTAAGERVAGYEIHLGRAARDADADAWLALDAPAGPAGPAGPAEAEGCRSADGRVLGTSLHGIFDADGFRAAFLGDVARRRGRVVRPSPVPFAERLEAQHDRLADWLEAHLDVEAVLAAAAGAVAPGAEPGWDAR